MNYVLEPGDIQLLCNHTMLHNRQEFIDHEVSANNVYIFYYTHLVLSSYKVVKGQDTIYTSRNNVFWGTFCQNQLLLKQLTSNWATLGATLDYVQVQHDCSFIVLLICCIRTWQNGQHVLIKEIEIKKCKVCTLSLLKKYGSNS